MGQTKPPKVLTGREGAKLVRGWMQDEFPPEVIETVLADLPWRESREPLGTRRDLWLWYWREIDTPLRMARVAALLRQAEGGIKEAGSDCGFRFVFP